MSVWRIEMGKEVHNRIKIWIYNVYNWTIHVWQCSIAIDIHLLTQTPWCIAGPIKKASEALMQMVTICDFFGTSGHFGIRQMRIPYSGSVWTILIAGVLNPFSPYRLPQRCHWAVYIILVLPTKPLCSVIHTGMCIVCVCVCVTFLMA